MPPWLPSSVAGLRTDLVKSANETSTTRSPGVAKMISTLAALSRKRMITGVLLQASGLSGSAAARKRALPSPRTATAFASTQAGSPPLTGAPPRISPSALYASLGTTPGPFLVRSTSRGAPGCFAGPDDAADGGPPGDDCPAPGEDAWADGPFLSAAPLAPVGAAVAGFSLAAGDGLAQGAGICLEITAAPRIAATSTARAPTAPATFASRDANRGRCR